MFIIFKIISKILKYYEYLLYVFDQFFSEEMKIQFLFSTLRLRFFHIFRFSIFLNLHFCFFFYYIQKSTNNEFRNKHPTNITFSHFKNPSKDRLKNTASPYKLYSFN
jgi:hypothetical protein